MRLRVRTKILTATAALLLSSGCATETTCPTDWCGTAVVVSARAISLFPPTPGWDVDVGLIDLMFSHLADVGPERNSVGDDGFIPKLARSWEFPDSLTIEFTLHPDARWHDGTPVTAQDVVFTFDVYRDPSVGFANRARLKDIESVDAVDAGTVRVRFSRHYLEQFFDAVAHVHILPRHLLDTIPPANLSTHELTRTPVGSGPYRFVRWTPGQSIELAGDSAYFLGRPGVPRIIWRFVGGPAAAVAEMVTGSADFLHHVSDPDDVGRLADVEHVRLIEYPSNAYNYVGFNLRDPERLDRPHPLFANRELRRAVALAVDVNAIVAATLGDYGIVANGPAPPSLWIWSDDLAPRVPFDTAQTRRMLRDLGWSDTDGDGILDRDGRSLSFELLGRSDPIRAQVSEILQAQLERVGIRMTIESPDFAAFDERVNNGRFDAQFSSVGFDPSPAGLQDWTSGGIGGFNYGAYVNQEFDALVQRAIEAPDRPTALTRWREAMQVITADAPAIWLYYPKKVAAVHTRLTDGRIRPDQPWAALGSYGVEPARLLPRDVRGSN